MVYDSKVDDFTVSELINGKEEIDLNPDDLYYIIISDSSGINILISKFINLRTSKKQ